MFDYPIPEDISRTSDNIVYTQKIPVFMEEKGTYKKKTYFVYAENKVLMKICNQLNDEDVSYMYELMHLENNPVASECEASRTHLSEALDQDEEGEEEDDGCIPSKEEEPRHWSTVKSHFNLSVKVEDLKKISGLKDVAFYYFVLILMKERMLTGLHTHTLSNIFDFLKTKRFNVKPRIDRILDQLGRYPMASSPPGLCVILNMEKNRRGADHDRQNVKELFQNHFKYDVIEKINPTSEDVRDIIRELKASRNKFYDR